MVYLHPLLGALFVILIVYLGSQGLRARHRAPYAPKARRIHGKLSWWVYGICVAALTAGVSSTWLLREDVETGSTWHFPVAVGVVLLMTLCAGLTRIWAGRPWARTAHWIFGLALMAAGLAVGALGMDLLP